jgi:hypothetical protein
LDKEDFVHKRNRGKGNFYSKDFTLEEVNQLIEDEKDAKKYRQLGDVNKLCLDAEKMRSMSKDLDTGGLWQIQQDRLEAYQMMLKLVAGILKTDIDNLADVALKYSQVVGRLKEWFEPWRDKNEDDYQGSSVDLRVDIKEILGEHYCKDGACDECANNDVSVEK